MSFSLREAMQLGHTYIGPEHILLGVLREGNGTACEVLVGLGVSPPVLRQRVIEFLATTPPEASPTLMPRPGVRPSEGRCVLCGRDLWEVDRYVSAETAAVCDHCVAAAERALHDAPPTTGRDVPMPPRVFGPDPQDPEAPYQIEQVVRAFFGGPIASNADPQRNNALIEDAEALDTYLAQAGERHANIQITGARVTRIRFLGPDEADVQYSIQLGPTTLPYEGRAVRRAGRWLVSRDTVVRHLAQGGIQVPPAK